ncbi:MAG: hypothetical protein MK078_03865 [Crocinitomicaceae bacterium]|nr:hypothetical protein [Crocinitomicaceae bacterium]
MLKLRFETENASHGLTRTKGFAWHDAEGIHFEHQVSDTILEVYKGDVKDSSIPYDQIQEIKYKNSWFSGGSVIIVLSSFKSAEELPFVQNGEVVLSLKRAQKSRGKEFAINAQLDLDNYRINNMV